MSSMDWDDLKVFTAIAHSGSVRAAARRLGIHHSTVARRLDHFEKRLGAVMFNRTPEGLKLSADGQLVLLQAEQVEGQIDDIERILVGRDQRLQGHVRITFPEPVGTGFLMRDLGRFVDRVPGHLARLHRLVRSAEPDARRGRHRGARHRLAAGAPRRPAARSVRGRRVRQHRIPVDARSGRASESVQLDRLGNRPIDQRSDAAAIVPRRAEPHAQSECAAATGGGRSRRRHGDACRACSAMRIRRSRASAIPL